MASIGRVCIVAPFPPRKGGVTVQTALLARYLADAGVEVVRVDTNLTCLRVRGLGWLRLAMQPLYIAIKLLACIRRVAAVQFQSCSYWGFMPAVVGVPIARLFGKRSIISFMGGLGPEFLDKYSWIVKPICRMATAVGVCSLELLNAFRERGVDVELLNNLYDAGLFSFRERAQVEPVMVWTRSFQDVYDPLMAVKAFELVKAKHPEATLTMTSDGELTESVKRYIAQRGITGVSLPGRVSTEEVARLMQEAGICLNTSKHDGFPTALLEAAGTGLAIVTTRVGGIPSVFRDGESAIMIEVGDSEAMARAVEDVLDDPVESLRCGRAARDAVRQYTWEHEWPKLQRYYGFVEEAPVAANR